MGNNTISFLAFFNYLATLGLQCLNSSRKLAFSKSGYLLLGAGAVAFSIVLAMLYPDPGLDIFKMLEHPSMLIHILIAILAFGLLGMAALQASLLYLKNQSLRGNASERMIRLLPPLQTMETLFFQILWSGFLLLSILLLTALFFLDSTWQSHHLQKIILSVLAWGLFATLLFAHHYSGLRGIKAIRWTLIGVGLLTLAYLAGKHI